MCHSEVPKQVHLQAVKEHFLACVVAGTTVLHMHGLQLFPLTSLRFLQEGKRQTGWVPVAPNVRRTESMETIWHRVTPQQDLVLSPVLQSSRSFSQLPAPSPVHRLLPAHLLLLVSTWHSTISPNTSKRFLSSRELMSLDRFRTYTTRPSPCSRRTERGPRHYSQGVSV